ncbi:hypothetical protein EMQ25_09680 [Arsenicitalea aurantiaca]|uniref:Uncharacterized protein n=1 Tax=Arsenicitalea aurantiaca TaxID=1783274 RepID=A0A433XAP7_9HYPH|nr:hypothetical protein [Arsenicitalea aurantiaca]RUT31132.1 hypothetical protein EMQ25_09680 [Arsenicitalea aurantiaca]
MVVFLSEEDEGVRGVVVWRSSTGFSNMTTEPLPVYRSFLRAHLVAQRFGLSRVLVSLEDRALWQPRWGVLLEEGAAQAAE